MSHLTEQEYLEAVEEARHILIATAENYCRVKDDAEDAVQEAILYCLRKLDQYDPLRASLITWVTTIVIARARDLNYYRERELDGGPIEFEEVDTGEHRRAQSKTATDRYDSQRNRVRLVDVEDEQSYEPDYDRVISVKQALLKLPEEQRSIAIAMLIEGMTYEEYAAANDISFITARRRLAAAKEQLKILLADFNV